MHEEVTIHDLGRIARMAHQLNKAYCEALGDFSQLDWEKTAESIKKSAVDGVLFHILSPEAGPAASHDNWMLGKVAEGWVYGTKKSLDAKTHPCLVPFDELPVEQRAKDSIFRACVHEAVALLYPPKIDNERPGQFFVVRPGTRVIK